MNFLMLVLIGTLSTISVNAKGLSKKYKVTFISQWNRIDHVSTPRNAHFSPLVAVTHNLNYELINLNDLASPGLKKVAEVGNPDIINIEIDDQYQNGNIGDRLNTTNLFINQSTQQSFEILISKDHPLLSLVSMIAPSPDWVVGISGLALYNPKKGFVKAIPKPIPLYAINAGTENGDQAGNYSINNSPTLPQQPITFLRGTGFDQPFAFVTIEAMN